MDVCCIIKPDGLPHAAEIIQSLVRAGMCVRERSRIIYTEDMIHQLYDHMNAAARTHIAASMIGKAGLALQVRTPNIVQLLAVIGCHSDPRRCSPNSIRFRYSEHTSPQHIDGWDWWENVMHRPVDMREAKRDIALFFPS
ncbi:MAG: hypothetical protein JWM39_504 [Parcubacteria group bacterium]|nr:hypothetical protein [Parcubacteria group bacterium]